MYSIFFMIKLTALATHTLIEFADDGSLQCMINNRFGHNCPFKISEYNIYFFNLILQRFWNGF